jgi:hypothetical protein
VVRNRPRKNNACVAAASGAGQKTSSGPREASELFDAGCVPRTILPIGAQGAPYVFECIRASLAFSTLLHSGIHTRRKI